jgi:hypothetical protein
MRSLSLSLFALLGACGASTSDPHADATVRSRLQAGETVLAISTADSTGTVSAARKSDGAWVPGLTDLRIDAGEVALSANADGTINVESIALDIGPIALPEELLGYPVELTDIHIGLVAPAKVLVTWESDDQAHGSASLDLLLKWSLKNHGTTSPLGSPDFPPVPVELSVVGDGSAVHAELRVSAPGELWKWGNLMKLEDLNLSLSGDTP